MRSCTVSKSAYGVILASTDILLDMGCGAEGLVRLAGSYGPGIQNGFLIIYRYEEGDSTKRKQRMLRLGSTRSIYDRNVPFIELKKDGTDQDKLAARRARSWGVIISVNQRPSPKPERH
jgi:hypothetical protein